jgi:hypothetical protein
MNIENLIITIAFKEVGTDKLTVVNNPYPEYIINLDRVPSIVIKELDKLVYDNRLEYPETASVSLSFNCVDFLDQIDLEPPSLYNVISN